MFTKSQLALVIGAVLAAPAVAEVQTTDEHLVVEGREFGYKADTNSTAMRMEMTQVLAQAVRAVTVSASHYVVLN